jgi:hypothetical protein
LARRERGKTAPDTAKEDLMKNTLMLGLWRYMIKVPPFLWEKQILGAKKKFEAELGFMTAEHRAVHHCAVRELPAAGRPLSPGSIAKMTDLPVDRVIALLEELEEHMTFLFRNAQGEVVWAYPVTVDRTPHRVTFNSGERLYAA